MDLGNKSHKKFGFDIESNVADMSYVAIAPGHRRGVKAVLVSEKGTPQGNRFLKVDGTRVRRRPQYVIDSKAYNDYIKHKNLQIHDEQEFELVKEGENYILCNPRDVSEEYVNHHYYSKPRPQSPIYLSKTLKKASLKMDHEKRQETPERAHDGAKPMYNVVFKKARKDQYECKYAEKTTYCRPVVHMYNQEYTFKDYEKQQRLQSIVKQLAEAREIEKQKASWNNYIKELKLKHGLLINDNSQAECSTMPHVPSVLTNRDLINNYFNTRFVTGHSDHCKDLLKEVYYDKDSCDLILPTQKHVSINTDRDTQNSCLFQDRDYETSTVNCNFQRSTSRNFEPTAMKRICSPRCPRCVDPRSFKSIRVPLVNKKALKRSNISSKNILGSKKEQRKFRLENDISPMQTEQNQMIRVTPTEQEDCRVADQSTETILNLNTKNMETEIVWHKMEERGEGTGILANTQNAEVETVEKISRNTFEEQINNKTEKKQTQNKTEEKGQVTEISNTNQIIEVRNVIHKDKSFGDAEIKPIYNEKIPNEIDTNDDKKESNYEEKIEDTNKNDGGELMDVFKQQYVKVCNNVVDHEKGITPNYNVQAHALRSIENKLDLLIIAINSFLVEGKNLYSCCNSSGSRDTALDNMRLKQDTMRESRSEGVNTKNNNRKINYRCNMPNCDSVRCMKRRKVAEEFMENDNSEIDNDIHGNNYDIRKRIKADIQFLSEIMLDCNKVTSIPRYHECNMAKNDRTNVAAAENDFYNNANILKLSVENIGDLPGLKQKRKPLQKSSSWYNLPIFCNKNVLNADKDQGNIYDAGRGDDYLCRLLTTGDSSLLFSERNTSESGSSKMDKIIIEEMDKSDQLKRDIEEILKGDLRRSSPCAVPCAVQINFDVPTRECCTEVTKSLSKTKIEEEKTDEIVSVNSRHSERRMTIAINTDPLSFFTLLKISTETIRKLLPNLNFDYYSYLPLMQQPQISRPMLTRAETFICHICGATFLKSSQLSDHILGHDVRPSRDCCVCRHLLEISRQRTPSVFSCRFCGQVFTRAYCRELHEQKCARRLGKTPDIPENLAILT